MKNTNIDLGKKIDLTSYRKISIASWNHPRDPSIYAKLEMHLEPAMDFLAASSTDTPLTLTHYVTKIISHCLHRYPEINSVLRWGNLYQRNHVDAFITTLIKSSKGKDLSGFIIRDADKMPITDMATFTKQKVDDLRRNKDPEHLKVQQLVDPLSTKLLMPIMLFKEFVQFTLNLAFPKLGMAKDTFGSVMISNIGALGIDNAYIPLSPYTRFPFFIGIGKPKLSPVIQGDKVVPGQTVTLTFTFDHRYGDGSHLSHIIRLFNKIFVNPEAYKHVFYDAVESAK